MTSTAKPIPEGYHSVTPYLIIKGAAEAIEFYKKAFGATELFRMPQPDGKIGHAEIKIGDSPIMLADEFPQMSYVGPKTLGGSPVSLIRRRCRRGFHQGHFRRRRAAKAGGR